MHFRPVFGRGWHFFVSYRGFYKIFCNFFLTNLLLTYKVYLGRNLRIFDVPARLGTDLAQGWHKTGTRAEA